MTRTAAKTAFFSAVALSTAFVGQSANAALITSWDYTVDSAFTSFSSVPSDTGGTKGNVVGSGTSAIGGNTTLTWGNPNGAKSSVSITPQVTSPPRLVTNGGPQDGATFTHNNQVISTDYSILGDFGITTRLSLQSATPTTGTDQVLPSLTFDSFFKETLNQAGTCTSGSASTCDDIFVLSNVTGGQDPLNISQTFTADDYIYTVMLNIGGVGLLADDQCERAGAASGCFGFLTQENNVNQFTSTFSITAEQRAVPEPSTLAMLGMGLVLVGGGFYSRRRNIG